MFCLNEYVGWNHRMLGSYRAVLGHFELDQWFMVVSAAVNLVLSFALFIPFGIAGALAATVVAHAIMWAGRVKVVCRLYMTGALGRYLRVQAAHLLTLGRLHGRDILGLRAAARRGLRLCRRVAVAALLPNLLNLACYAWTSDAAYLREYAGGLWRKIKNHRRS